MAWRIHGPFLRGLVAMGVAVGAVTAGAFDDLTALSDEFDDAARLSDWSRIHQVEGWGNDVLEAFDIHTTRPGQMVMMPYASSWFGEYRGELSFKTVTGDFAITTFVEPRNRAGTGRPERDYSLAGIMVRAPRAMTNINEWTANGQNYVFLSMGAASRVNPGYEFEVKTTSNSTSVLFVEGTDATRAAIQVARIGPHLLMLRRDEGGEWMIHRRYHRPDFPATLQAGLTVYTDWSTVNNVGVQNNNQLILTNGAPLIGGGTLSNAQPDLVASFEYVRYARPDVPPGLAGADLSHAGEVSDEVLLSFLGEPLNVPGGAASAPEWTGMEAAHASVVSQRTYRVQMAPAPDGPWSDLEAFVSTNTLHSPLSVPPTNDSAVLRLVSP